MKRKIIYLLAIIFLVSAASFAQDNKEQGRDGKKRSPEEMMKREMQLLNDSLNLTDSQKPFVRKILEDSFKKMSDIRKNGGGMDDMKSVMDERDSNLKIILTEEQWAKYSELQKMRRNKLKDDNSGNRKHNHNGNNNE